MLQEKRGALVKGILLGIVLGLAANALFLVSQSLATLLLAALLGIASTVFFVRGCWQHAVGKGYPGAVGLLGLLGLIGLIVLLVLPDKHPENLRSYAYTPSGSFPGPQHLPLMDGLGEPAPYSPAPVAAPVKSSNFSFDAAEHWSVKASRPQ